MAHPAHNYAATRILSCTRQYEAIGMFLEAIGSSHVLVLSLDDLQWADTASLDLLCHLARHQPNAHLLILGAYRESELDRCPVLARSISELSRLRVLATITIGRLSVIETCLLAEDKLGGSLHTDVNSLLYMHSEGNPFFAEELLDDWIEGGGLVHEHHQWVAVSSLAHALPPSIVGALRQRFTRLSAQLLADDLEQNAWYRRVASLTENRPMLTEYTREWQG